jgi:hypothetical protein
MSPRQLRRVLPAVAVALLLVTAGCSFGGGGGTPTPDPGGTDAVPTDATTGPSTTEPTGTAPTAEPTPGNVSVAGVEDGRLVDAEALAAAHQRALLAAGFETRLVQNASIVVPTGPDSEEVAPTTNVRQVLATAGGEEYRYRQTTGAVRFELQAWGNRSTRVFRTLQGREVVQTRIGEPTPPSTLAGRETVREYLAAGNFTRDGTVTRDGERLAVLRADDLVVENDTDLFVAGSADYANYSSTVLVGADGVVRGMEVSATYALRGERHAFETTFSVLRQGSVTFERPGWVGEVLRATTPTDEPPGTGTPVSTGTPP